MIVVNVNSGLGNQMYHYALYLALKKLNPIQKCYIDTSIFEIKHKEKKYALEDIFNLSIPNIKDVVTPESYADYIKKARPVTERLLDNWLSKSAVVCRELLYSMLNEKGYDKWMDITDLISDTYPNKKFELLMFLKRTPVLADWIYKLKKQDKNYNLRKFYSSVHKMTCIKRYCMKKPEYYSSIMEHQSGNICYIGNFEDGNIYFKSVESEVKNSFQFPKLDKENIKISKEIQDCNSVSIHIRRGDHLESNVDMTGEDNFFKRAIQYIKINTSKPIFYVFSDDIDWCKKNQKDLGLTEGENVYFIDWNTGNKSFRDMQLMSLCKHNIIPVSTFSWWASYLNTNPYKIVIAPVGYWGNATVNV